MSVRKKIDISGATAAKLTAEGDSSDLAKLKANGPRALPQSPTASGWDARNILKQFYKQPEMLFAWLKAVADALETLGVNIDDYLDSNDDTVVHLAGAETITGKKTFTDDLKLGSSGTDNSKTFDAYFTVNLRGPVNSSPIYPGNTGFSIGGSSASQRWNTVYTKYLDVSQTIKSGDYTYFMPYASGILATTDDIDGEIDKIKDGTYTAKKAEKDANGNTISSTYETKADASGKVARANLVSILGEASTSLSGLLSATDKARLDALYALLGAEADSDTVVNTINEVLAIFNQYPEGVTLTNALATKLSLTDAASTYLAKTDAYAIGFLKVGDYDQSTGKISITHSSDYTLSYNSSTGVLSISA